ncbi:HNH endonuclease [Parabacteroides distasonis]|nr:HNH endonuclease [Parabacteroides distasonis]
MNELIEQVWKKAKEVEGRNPDIWRKDFAGAWIRRDEYGVRSKYGWVVDHVRPNFLGGDDSLSNLQTLHWRNNKSKGNDYSEVETCITSEGNDNIYKVRRWRLNTKK